jgi:hypothetical protein
MLKVMVVGLGPIGLACAKAVVCDRDLRLVGMADKAPPKIGKTLAQLQTMAEGAVAEMDEDITQSRCVVHGSIEGAIQAAGGPGSVDIAILTTSSSLSVVAPTIYQLLDQKIAVISSCEQLAWPWYRNAALAGELDAHAKGAGRAVMGAGVNPGFIMDYLAVAAATMVRRVTGVVCTRRVDAALRRQPLQAKIGATMKPERFRELAAEGKIGHEGIAESVALLAAGLGRTVPSGSITVTLEPVIADRATPSALGLIQPGYVAGMRNVATWSGDGISIELDLTMAVGLHDPMDRIEVAGPVQITLEVTTGTPGDSATVAALINHLRPVAASTGGLLTMLDMPPAGCRGRD